MSLPKARFKVLVIDDESDVRKLVRGRLERRGHEVIEAADGAQALLLAKKHSPSVAVSDIRMPGLDGFAVLEALKIPTLLITGHGDKESAIRAVEAGAFSFFEKPFDLDALEVAVLRGAERHHMELERADLLRQLDRLCRLQERELQEWDKQHDKKNGTSLLVGSCPALLDIREVLNRLAQKPRATLLILGETGTGKEVVARELHKLTHDDKAHKPFLALNCASIPTELFESELYGHEKGSFSGALQTRIGLAEAVREGTLFLDEVGELDPRHQAKLLRLVQERSFRRVGSNVEQGFSGRIVAATHRNLKNKDSFREDLFYRLAVVSVTLPPLRERGGDIAELAQVLCERQGLKGIAPERVAELLSYPWPGNIRELNNWIERAAILGLHDVKGYLTDPVPTEGPVEALPKVTQLGSERNIKILRQQLLERYDREWILQALSEHRGNVSSAARSLGLDRKNLAKRMKDLGIESPSEKKAA